MAVAVGLRPRPWDRGRGTEAVAVGPGPWGRDRVGVGASLLLIRFRWFRFGVRQNSRAFKALCGRVVGATTVQMVCDSPRMVGDASCASYGVETFDALNCVKASHRNPLEYTLAILPALVLQQLPCCLEAFLVDGLFSVHECCSHIVYRRRELSRDHRELRIFFQNGPTFGFRTTICEAIEVIDHVHRRKMSTVGPSLVR